MKTTTTATDSSLSTYDIVYGGDATTIMASGNAPVSKAKNRDDVCGVKKCAEELNPLGPERAELLADWFKQRGLTRRLDAVISSHKRRTFQTVAPTADDRRFPKDEDGKVRDFGDIWKVVVYPNGEARFAYRVNLQPKALFVNNFAR